jgi:glycosyltransferase involved in cell wall biosynthesis
MFKLLFDTTPLLPRPSGVGFYVIQLLQALDALQTTENFQLDLLYQPSLKNFCLGNFSLPESLRPYPRIHKLRLPVRLVNLLARFPNNPILAYLEQSWDRPNIIHGTNFAVYPSRHSHRVMTVYDLTFFKYPQYVTQVVKTYRTRVQQCLQWSDLILAISESTKQDLIECFNLDPNRIWVTPLASRYTPHQFSPHQLQHLSTTVAYDFSKPYILFVSTLEPRKNLLTLIQAFNRFKDSHQLDHQLILIGQRGWQYEPIIEAIQQSPWRNAIHHLDYLSSDQVALFYTKADLFAYPSHYEGFGLPPLEAMTLGTPVIVANTSSLPEVVGDAAIQVPPTDIEAWAEALAQLTQDTTLRQTLITKGHHQAQHFSWQRTAQQTLAAYRTLL